MKKYNSTTNYFVLLLLISFLGSCEPVRDHPAEEVRVRNTMKSVSLFHDTAGVDPAQLLADLDLVNISIDSIGFPDAGYKLWMVSGSDSAGFKYMVEGYWPDQESYAMIHDHVLYKNARNSLVADWGGMKSVWYHQFERIK